MCGHSIIHIHGISDGLLRRYTEYNMLLGMIISPDIQTYMAQPDSSDATIQYKGRQHVYIIGYK